jgi:hypothetical protein
MNVLLLRTWIVNIGNAFIEKGARALVRAAIPDANIVESSGYPNLVGARRSRPSISMPIADTLTERLHHGFTGTGNVQDNPRNIAELVDVDVAVLPGCTLYSHVLDPYASTLESLREDGIPLIFLGAGGSDYNTETREYVSRRLRGLEPDGIVTRDSTAYEKYGDLAEAAHDGIDCAFYLPDWHRPVDSTQKLTALTFDKHPEPEIGTEHPVFRPCHTPFGTTLPFDRLSRRLNQRRNTRRPFRSRNRYVSDLVTDYLFIYANAAQTHSDRIHACVPALAYGKRAKFYYDTPRAKLFDRVLDQDITTNMVSLDPNRLSRLKKEQTESFEEMVESAID